MKQSVFVDTSFLVALIDKRDALNEQAVVLSKKLQADRVELISTDAVLIELANYFSKSPLRVEAITWIEHMRRDDSWEIVLLERSLLAQGEARYRRYRNKTWTLTDCTSMEVMRHRRIKVVATADRHFAQAGFHVLLN